MSRQRAIIVVLCVFATSALSAASGFEWVAATPQSQGMSLAKLDQLRDHLAGKNTKALLVVRNDKIVYEWYSDDHGPEKRHYTASMAKALVGGVSLAVAISDGRISLDDLAAKHVPQWREDKRKSTITIRQLGSHTSGIEDAEADGLSHEHLTGWKGDFWKRLSPPRDPFSISRDAAPVLFAPGEQFSYSNPGIAMLGYALTAALRDAPEKDLRSLLRRRIMRPIGVEDDQWQVGYGTTFEVGGLPLIAPWGGGNYTARAAARVGRLMLREGNWDGVQLINADAVRATTGDAGLPNANGMGWWTNAGGRFPKLPRDAYYAAGAGHQTLLVVPSLNLICVRNGGDLVPRGSDKDEKARGPHLFDPLMDAIVEGTPPRTGEQLREDQRQTNTARERNNAAIEGWAAKSVQRAGRLPYPPSRIIIRIDWAPEQTIVRRANGSDNWPLTWADDGNLYTAYGDGWGFEPHVEKKLSMGFAKIVGGPEEFLGVNVRSPTGETLGQGAEGPKASGILMVEGMLYLWVRNCRNSQLAWSGDCGQTWTWSDWKFTTSFGCPTFLNFGENYEGARDQYVYVYSPDSDSAYQPSDHMVLARVAKNRIVDRDAYEFFTGMDEQYEAHWTKDIQQRGAVFTHAGRCYRTGISYNAGLKRYLWCQIHPESTHSEGPRFQGGFGVYEAPEPWGPWSTVFFTNAWDVGPGETSSFPTKWISADGHTLHLVFSGNDCFSVRQATLTTTAKD